MREWCRKGGTEERGKAMEVSLAITILYFLYFWDGEEKVPYTLGAGAGTGSQCHGFR